MFFIFSLRLQLYNKRGQRKLPYFEVIIDPDNMMNTFDNALTLSFFFREGKIGFDEDVDGLPTIWPIDKKDVRKDGHAQQFLSSIDYDLCEEMMKRYKITKPLLNVNRDDPDDTPE